MDQAKAKPVPMSMAPRGLAGRIFGVLMETLNRPSYERALSLLGERGEGEVLEIGFGTGKLIEMIARRHPGARITGLDPAPTMVEVARNRRGVRRAAERIVLAEGGAGPLAFADGRFDAVLALHSFQFWPEPEAALGEIIRVLKPGGALILLLRAHEGRRVEWLPNPISRSGDEIDQTLALLARLGLTVRFEAAFDGASPAILAVKG